MTLDLEVNEVEVKVLTSLASVTGITGHIQALACGVTPYEQLQTLRLEPKAPYAVVL
jgi:hypothetical protein